MKKIKLSRISALHYYKLVFRSLLFLAALVYYIVVRMEEGSASFADLPRRNLIIGIVWVVFTVEMILRFFPSRLESMGCQKQFTKNYKPIENAAAPSIHKGVLAVILSWVALNGAIGALYYTHVIDKGILLLIALFYSVCDMICILFFCPFHTWMMKNKCCATCRIYNWDYAMMFTPLVFIIDPFAVSLVVFSLLLLVRWEVTALRHPERFSEKHNDCLSCKNCPEKLCHHKKQLQRFLKENKERLSLTGNAALEHLKENLPHKK